MKIDDLIDLAQESTNFPDNTTTKGLIRIVVLSLTNHSNTLATLNNYLWCMKYSS